MANSTTAEHAVIRRDISKFKWTMMQVKQHKVAYLMIAPFFILFFIFTVVPVLLSIVLSFTTFNLLEWPTLVYADNYIRLFLDDEIFLIAVKNTLMFAIITGQKPITCKARKSVANFKVREGETVGVKVTLRGDKMYEFLDRLFSVALPRVRDFRGINPNSFDGRGNYAFGLKEQLIFPEIEYDKVDKIRGMDICICTTAATDEEAKELLTLLGAPFTA